MRELLPLRKQGHSGHLPADPTSIVGDARGRHVGQARHEADPDAHQLYLKGRYYFKSEGPATGCKRASIIFIRRWPVTRTTPPLMRAWPIPGNLIAFYGFDPSLKAVDEARASADKALRLDNSMAAPHAARAYTEFMWPGQLARS